MKVRSLMILGFGFFLSTTPAHAGLVVFDFEAESDSESALVSKGFVFDPGAVDWHPDWIPGSSWIGHYHIPEPHQTGFTAYNGTKYFTFDYFSDGSRLNIYGVSNQIFGVKQLDVAEGGVFSSCLDSIPRCDLTFEGIRPDGVVISRTVTLDAISDGIGPLADFETFTFDAQWNRLVMFTIAPASTSDHYLNPSIDNVVLRTVPEPATLGLLGVGLVGILLNRRRNARQLVAPAGIEPASIA